jgi:enoyl reductase
MRRRLLARTASLTAAALVATALLAAPAWADDSFGGPTSTQGVTQNGGSYIPQVTVTITVNGTRTSTATVSSQSVGAHPPCWYEPSWTGPDRADYYDSGQAARDARHHDDPQLADKPAGYADHKNDGPDKGMFWSAICSSAYWNTDDIHAFTTFAEQWINQHQTIWVPNGAPNPNTQIVIPPRVLMQIARNALHPGAPELEVNPQADSVVNLPTWVWATDDTFVQIQATAAFNGNWATVIARPGGLRLSTDGPADVDSTCSGGGKPWTKGAADSDCTVTFRKSTAGSGEYVISASIDWQVHWEGSGGENEALPPPPNAPIGEHPVQVDEVQTVVNGQATPRG